MLIPFYQSATMLEAEVPVELTLSTCTGTKAPVLTPEKVIWSPPAVTTFIFPAVPQYNTHPSLVASPYIMYDSPDAIISALRDKVVSLSTAETVAVVLSVVLTTVKPTLINSPGGTLLN